jgi:hypothetical protein
MVTRWGPSWQPGTNRQWRHGDVKGVIKAAFNEVNEPSCPPIRHGDIAGGNIAGGMMAPDGCHAVARGYSARQDGPERVMVTVLGPS